MAGDELGPTGDHRLEESAVVDSEFPSRILVLLDDSAESESALRRAVRLAARADGEVFALRVVEPPRSHFFTAEAQRKHEQLYAELQTRLEEELAATVSAASEPGVSVVGRVLRGRPYQEAIREVLRHDLDLVLVGAPPVSGGHGGADLDSEVHHLLRKCPCPVWVDRARGEAVRRLLVAVDLEPADESPPRLSAKLMRLALAIAQADDVSADSSAAGSSAIHIAHTWTIYREESTLRLAGEAARWLSQEASARHGERLRSFLADFSFSGTEVQVHLENGHPEDVIPRLLLRERLDLLVLGSVTRPGIPGLLIGSTAERLIQRARCSLLAAKPDGFESSVKVES